MPVTRISPEAAAALLVLLATVATLILVLWRRQRSRRALVRQVSLLADLADAGRAIAEAEQDEAALLELIYQQVGKIVDTSTFQLGLFEGDVYRIVLWTRQGERQPATHFTLTDDNPGLVGWVRDHQQPILIRDYLTEVDSLPARPRYFSEDSPRSAVFVPLVVADDSVGLMAIQSWQPNAYGQNELELLTILANQAAVALRNAQALRDLRRRTAALALLVDASRDLNRQQPLNDLAQQIVELVQDKFGIYGVHFFTAERGGVVLAASTADSAMQMPYCVLLGSGLIGAAAQGEVVLSNRANEDARFLPDPAFPDTVAELVMPVIADEQVLGVLDMQSDQPDFFHDEDVSVYRALADQLALAMLEARHWQAQHVRTEQLSALAAVSRAATSTLVLDDLLDDVVDLIEMHFDYTRIQLFLLHGDQLVFRAGVGGAAQRWLVEGLHYALEGPGLIAYTARTGEPVLVADVRRDPRYMAGRWLEDTLSELAVPLRVNDRLLGVLDVQSPEEAAFSDSDVQVLQALADNIAVAVRNAQLYTRERQRRQLSDSVREISAAISATLDLDVVFARILGGLALVVPYQAAGILVREDDDWVLRAAIGLPEDAAHLIGQVIDPAVLADWVGAPGVVRAFSVPPTHPVGRLLGLTEGAGVLLGNEDEQPGLLLVGRSGVVGFLPEEEEVIATFGAQAAVAIKNANLFVAQREEAWISSALLGVADAIAQIDDLDQVLRAVVRQLPGLADVQRCALLVYDLESDTFGVRAAQGADYLELALDVDPDRLRVRADDWPPLADLRSVYDMRLATIGPSLPSFLVPDFGACQHVYVLPLRSRGQLAGALLLELPDMGGYSGYAHELLNGIASQAATAIEAARLNQQQQEEAWVSTALLQVAEAVAVSKDAAEAIASVLRLTPLLVGVEWCAVLLWQPDTQCFRFGGRYGVDGPALEAHPLLALELGLADLGLTALPIGSNAGGGVGGMQVVTLSQLASALLSDATARVIGVQLRGTFFGAMLVDARTLLSGRRLNILTGAVGQLAVALENDRLAADAAVRQQLERELRVAQSIQLSFLPRTKPDIDGWEVAALYRPARQVGGDFYDFIPLPQGRWGVVVADVSDKGIPAALYMALSRTLLRAVAPEDLSPERTLARMNQLILDQSENEQFVTCFYAVWEPSSGRLAYANAGHNWPLLVTAAGQVARVPGRQGMPLGIFEQISLYGGQVMIEPGAMVVLYSDGVTDVHAGDWVRFGEAGLKSVLHSAAGQSAEGVLQNVEQAVAEFAEGEPPFDDITLVVLKRQLSA